MAEPLRGFPRILKIKFRLPANSQGKILGFPRILVKSGVSTNPVTKMASLRLFSIGQYIKYKYGLAGLITSAINHNLTPYRLDAY